MITGEQIKQAREEQNLSQEALSELLGVSRQAVSKWENDLSIPQGENRRRLMEVLQLTSGDEMEEKIYRANRSFWIGWAVAAFLLIVLIGTWVYIYQCQNRQDTPANDANLCIQFYDSDQKAVSIKNSCYNSAQIDTILVQWEGEGAKSIDMYCRPEGFSDNIMLSTQTIPAGSSAILLSGRSLSSYMEGQIFFELKFKDQVSVSEKYNICCNPMIYVYIREFSGRSMVFDEVEWVETPGERATELGLVDEGSGFIVYNEKENLQQLELSEDCVCEVLDWTENFVPMEVPPEKLAELLAERDAPNIPYILTIEGEQITYIQEKYVP